MGAEWVLVSNVFFPPPSLCDLGLPLGLASGEPRIPSSYLPTGDPHRSHIDPQKMWDTVFPLFSQNSQPGDPSGFSDRARHRGPSAQHGRKDSLKGGLPPAGTGTKWSPCQDGGKRGILAWGEPWYWNEALCETVTSPCLFWNSF